MTEIIIVGCVGGCISALSYKFIQDNLKIENEKKNNIAEYIRLDFEICEKQKELRKNDV
jgi:predicted alternative tryptophan synthase beta-subunit